MYQRILSCFAHIKYRLAMFLLLGITSLFLMQEIIGREFRRGWGWEFLATGAGSVYLQ